MTLLCFQCFGIQINICYFGDLELNILFNGSQLMITDIFLGRKQKRGGGKRGQQDYYGGGLLLKLNTPRGKMGKLKVAKTDLEYCCL